MIFFRRRRHTSQDNTATYKIPNYADFLIFQVTSPKIPNSLFSPVPRRQSNAVWAAGQERQFMLYLHCKTALICWMCTYILYAPHLILSKRISLSRAKIICCKLIFRHHFGTTSAFEAVKLVLGSSRCKIYVTKIFHLPFLIGSLW